MPIQIHNKTYITVAERVQEAGKDFIGLNTEVLNYDPVVIKATVTTTKGTFTGISYANASKTIEAQSPYEVAETSAVGRALGFAGYGIVEGIASADEIVKAEATPKPTREEANADQKAHFCTLHQKEMKQRDFDGQIYFDHRMQIQGVWNKCSGMGYKADKPYTKPEPVPERDIYADIDEPPLPEE